MEGLEKPQQPNMGRMKDLPKVSSYDHYEQLRQEQPSSSDISRVTRIFSSRNDNILTPTETVLRKETEAGETVMTVSNIVSSPKAGLAGDGRREEADAISSAGITISQRGFERQLTCPPEEHVVRRYNGSEQQRQHLKKIDSFDEVDQFQRFTSVSLTEPDHGESLRCGKDKPLHAEAESGASPTRVLSRVVQFAPQCRDENDVSIGVASGHELQFASSYGVRNDELLTQRSSSSNHPSPGCDSNEKSARPRRKDGHSFDFGVLTAGDPPTQLIGAFLQRQTESGSHFLDIDLDMEELATSPTADGGLSMALEEKTGSSENNPSPRDSSYSDLVRLDRPDPSSISPPSNVAARSPTIGDGLHTGGSQSFSYYSPPFSSSLHREGNHDVAINVNGDHRGENGMDETAVAAAAAACTRISPSRSSDVAGQGVRWRGTGTANASFKSASPRVSSAEVEVLKAPAQYAPRPTFSRMKSRLADIPRPPEVISATPEDKLKSAQLKNSQQVKSGLMGNKLKKVSEEEEEDPLKVSDLPENYHKRDKGPWNVIQFLAFLLIVGGLVSILVFPTLRTTKRGGLMLWKWALLVMVVFSGRLISGWIIWLLVFIIEKNFLLRKRVVYFVYALRKGVQNCVWLGFALLAWHLMIDPKVDSNLKVVRYVTKVLICFLVAAIIVLVKTLIVKVFASSFHVNNYFERIQEALFNQYIMETLSGPPMIEYATSVDDDQKKLKDEIAGLKEAGASGPSLSKIPDLPPKKASGLGERPSMTGGSGVMGSGMIGSGMVGKGSKATENKSKSKNQTELNKGISVEYLQKLDLTNISAWNMKRLIHIVKNSTLTHSLEESVYAEGMETEIQSEWQAKSAAKQIFRNVAKPYQKVITEDDLLRFMREEETKRAWALFDGATEKKCITKQALKNWVISVYRERRALALTLNDTKTAVNKLHRIVDVVVGIIIIIIWLLVLGIATTKLLLFMSSQILLLILVWGNTLKTVFEAIVFLFVMHPFDVGDRCVIDGMQLVVEEMNILTTVFLGDFNVKIWFPNAVLATKPIQNYYRSPEMGDGVEFIVHASTPMEKVAAFKEKIGRYIESKPERWHQDYVLNVLQMTEGEKMKLSLGVKHTMNYQDMGEIVKRRSELLTEVNFCLRELNVEYHLPAQEVHITKFKE